MWAGTHSDGRNGPVVFAYSDTRLDETIVDLIGEYEYVLQSGGLFGYDNAIKGKNFTHLCLIYTC